MALFAAESTSVRVTDVLAGLGSVIGALILAGLALYWRRLPLLRAYRPNAPLASAARRFQSGVVNDYVTWIVIGLACLGGVFAVVIGLPGCLCTAWRPRRLSAAAGRDADHDRARMDLDAHFLRAGRAPPSSSKRTFWSNRILNFFPA